MGVSTQNSTSDFFRKFPVLGDKKPESLFTVFQLALRASFIFSNPRATLFVRSRCSEVLFFEQPFTSFFGRGVNLFVSPLSSTDFLIFFQNLFQSAFRLFQRGGHSMNFFPPVNGLFTFFQNLFSPISFIF